MGDVFWYPRIASHHYKTLRGLDGSDLPDTYDEWLKLATKIKLERGRMGFDVREVEINPHEFVSFCSARGIAPHGASLLSFSVEKGSRNI